MKLSVSIPDELWRQNAEPDDSASQVIQSALTERAQRRQLEAQREAVPDRLRSKIEQSAKARYLDRAKLSFELGYQCGGAALELLEWPDVEIFTPTPDPLGYLEDTFTRYMDAILLQHGPTHDANPAAEEDNERALTTREGVLLGQLSALVNAWIDILHEEVDRGRPISEAEIDAATAAAEGVEYVIGGETADTALAPFRDWFVELGVGYRTWANGFSQAIAHARTAVLSDAHLSSGENR